MNELKIFENPEFGKVRVIAQNGDPWFGASDVAKALGYRDTDSAVRAHCNYAKLFKPGDMPGLEIGPRGMCFIPESDMYALIFGSKLPQAVAFRAWVCEEVLPSIRKTGGYGTVALPNFSDPVEAARAWADKEEQRRLEEHAKLMALETIEVQKPLVQIAEERIDKKGCFSITDVNRSLGLKRGEITKWAKDKGYLHKRLPEVNNAGLKYFKVYSTDGVHNQIGITEDGVQLIKKILLGE